MLNVMEQHDRINNVFNVKHVLKLLFGKNGTTKNIVNNIGLSYGLLKAIPFVNYPSFQATADQNLKESKITGFIKNLKNIMTIPNTNTCSLTALTFIKMGVL